MSAQVFRLTDADLERFRFGLISDSIYVLEPDGTRRPATRQEAALVALREGWYRRIYRRRFGPTRAA